MIKKSSEPHILWFKEISLKDIPLVGGKNAALGEMYGHLTKQGIRIPNGFAITAGAYRYFLETAGLKDAIKDILKGLDTGDVKDLARRGEKVRALILKATLPADLAEEIETAYRQLEKMYGKRTDVAVRSSATAEDLPGASFAGQQETFLNIEGSREVVAATKKCIASLFTNRAISYRQDKGFSHFDIALSVGVQKMVRTDLAASGVAFTIDTETGFDKVAIITASWGLGEMVVQGKVTPDEFVVFKPTLKLGKNAIISRRFGNKREKMIYAGEEGIKTVSVPAKDRLRPCLTDKEVTQLAKWCVTIEEYFSRLHKHYQPMDIEWGKDGRTGELFIVQARPETVQSTGEKGVYKEYQLKKTGKLLVSGIAVGEKIGRGKVRIIHDPSHLSDFMKGEVLVTKITDPDWEPIMKIASAIITEKGGRTSHAAIVSRELGIPCIVGAEGAISALKNGQEVTVDCSSGSEGRIFAGILPFGVAEHHLAKMPSTKTKIMVNIGSPEDAFRSHYLPVQGVGLGRLEFIIASHIAIHPNALLDFKKLQKEAETSRETKALVKKIEERTVGYKRKDRYYVDRLAEGIAMIGATFYPHEVIIRFSDFKTNEYRALLGGERYELVEENPMIGFRGASRYYDPKFATAFGLECEAMKRVRADMGLTNVVPMIPFCRTPEEGAKVISVMASHGLDRKRDGSLKVYVMCEIPSNILLADEFLKIFDGMSIGSNDLTQLTMGIDRDSGIVTSIANENNEAVKTLIRQIIAKCRAKKKYIGICGQAPSDYPDFANFLVGEGIESMSLNPDSVIRTLIAIAKQEGKGKRAR